MKCQIKHGAGTSPARKKKKSTVRQQQSNGYNNEERFELEANWFNFELLLLTKATSERPTNY